MNVSVPTLTAIIGVLGVVLLIVIALLLFLLKREIARYSTAADKVTRLEYDVAGIVKAIDEIRVIAREMREPAGVLKELDRLLRGPDQRGGIVREMARSRAEHHWGNDCWTLFLEWTEEMRRAFPGMPAFKLPRKDEYMQRMLEREGLA